MISFFFQKNSLVINRLPVEFSGKLDFLKNGYDIDFTVTSEKSDLNDFITALPSQYVSWQQQTKIKGNSDFNIYPNPVTDKINIAYSLRGKENIKIDMRNFFLNRFSLI